MIVAELKRLHSPEIDLEDFQPDEPENFGFLLQAMIGPAGEQTEDSFDILVCTPKWLIENKADQGVLFGRHYLITFTNDLSVIEAKMRSYCTRCHGKTWEEVAVKVGRMGMWEFEDYRPES